MTGARTHLLWALLGAQGCITPEQYCLNQRGGGYLGADIEAIEAECRLVADSYQCESDDYMEADAATCFLEQLVTQPESQILGQWRETVVWCAQNDSEGGCINATDGGYVYTVILDAG